MARTPVPLPAGHFTIGAVAPRAFLHKETLMSQAAPPPGSPRLSRRALGLVLALVVMVLAAYLATTRWGPLQPAPAAAQDAKPAGDDKAKEDDADPPRYLKA